MDKAAVLAEIDKVFARCGTTWQEALPRPFGTSGFDNYIQGNGAAMQASLVAAIHRYAPQREYLTRADALDASGPSGEFKRVKALLGILKSIRQDIEDGFTVTLRRRVEDEVFDDLLEMAAHLAKPSMHPPSGVVLAVSVLEKRIRGLAATHGIAVEGAKGPRSFEDLVADLYGDDHITKAESRLLGGWYGQRNEAAHGHFENVNDGAVPGIIDGIRAFLVKYA